MTELAQNDSSKNRKIEFQPPDKKIEDVLIFFQIKPLKIFHGYLKIND